MSEHESEEVRFACIGCGALNPSGAEVCSGCGHRFAGPDTELSRQSLPVSSGQPEPEVWRISEGYYPFDPRDHDPKSSIAASVGSLLWKLVIFLVSMILVGLILIIALATAVFVTCSGVARGINLGVTIAWTLIAIGVISLLVVGLKGLWGSNDSGRRNSR